MRRSIDSKCSITLSLTLCLVVTSYSAVALAESLFDQIHGRNSGEYPDKDERYREGEDAPYLASQNLWDSKRLRSLASRYGIEAALAEDQTIRPGDIISTSKGVMVFVVSRTASGDRVGSLVPLNATSLRTQRRLQVLDKAARRDSPALD